MCLGVPMRVVSLEGERATVEVGGVRKEASLQLLDDVNVGDFVIIHAGFAIQKVDREDAEETLRLFAEFRVPTDS